ncbi:MAG: protein tyrosine phosphatase family protein [Phycisphaeraceae bacterium]|nr:protein tyrosine phosphatase family protein [Phycisphaeraceae bacterium]
MKHTAFLPLLLAVLVLGGCVSTTHPSPPASVEPTTCGNIKNMHRVGGLYLAGAPTPGDYPLIKELGIKTVLSIRHDKETPGLDAAALVEAQGMAYVHLPWSGAAELTDDKLDAMRQVLRDAERPMLFHCGSANRVGAGWLAYRVLDEGVELDTALAETKTFGLRTASYELITLDYIARRSKQ